MQISMSVRLVMLLSASLLATACVRAPPKPSPTTEVAALKPQPGWAATHYKVGARLYPRCVTLVATGSRVNKSTYCMTDDEIAAQDDRSQSIKSDLQQQRGQILRESFSN